MKNKYENNKKKMSERVISGRHRISPSPGKGSAVAYSPCPRSDDDMPGNVLAIPMSAIQTGNSGNLCRGSFIFNLL